MPKNNSPNARRRTSRDVHVIATRRSDPDLRRLARALIELAHSQSDNQPETVAGDEEQQAA